MTEHYLNFSLENIVEEIDGVVYTEEWRTIVNYEGLYEVSNFGRIKSSAKSWASGIHYASGIRNEKIVKQAVSFGYLRIHLSKKCKIQAFQVHRLVAAAFIENTHNKPQVNHLLGNKKDNRATKLEWATRSEDELHSYRVLGKTPSTTWKVNFDKTRRERKVVCLNNGESFKSIAEAANKIGLNRRYLNKVCSGQRKQIKGFIFKYI